MTIGSTRSSSRQVYLNVKFPIQSKPGGNAPAFFSEGRSKIRAHVLSARLPSTLNELRLTQCCSAVFKNRFQFDDDIGPKRIRSLLSDSAQTQFSCLAAPGARRGSPPLLDYIVQSRCLYDFCV